MLLALQEYIYTQFAIRISWENYCNPFGIKKNLCIEKNNIIILACALKQIYQNI